MDSATGWVLGVFGALIGGVILLFIEYNYFQKKKHDDGVQKDGGAGGILWKDAITRAVQDFGTSHVNSAIKISGWSVVKDRAQVRVSLIAKPPANKSSRVPSFQEFRRFRRPTHYTLVVDRAGDILEIKPR